MSNMLRATIGLVGLVAVAPGGSASAALPPECAQGDRTVTCRYEFTGASQSFTVPRKVRSVSFDVAGGQGADAPSGDSGGGGAELHGTLAVTPGQVITLTVGGQGNSQFGGFGGGGGGGGGGYSCPGQLVNGYAGGGGGGSSYIDPSVTESTLTDGAHGGDGAITVTYLAKGHGKKPTATRKARS
jgi:hypothetical protein